MRIFALVLGFNHNNNQLRFLVFHRGGLAASDPYDITKPGNLRGVARLFLTLLSWRTAAEAGFLTCCSDTAYLLPADGVGKDYVRAKVEKILFRSLCIRGRMTHVFLLSLPTDAPSADSQSEKEQLKPPIESTRGLRRSPRLALSTKPATTPQEKGKSAAEKKLPESGQTRPGPTTRSGSKKSVPSSEAPEQTSGRCSPIRDVVVS
jgi:hypothetical protein